MVGLGDSPLHGGCGSGVFGVCFALPVASFSAVFLLELEVVDLDEGIDGFGHIVESECGDCAGGEGLHLDTCFCVVSDGSGDAKSVFVDGLEVDVDAAEGEWVAEGDQVGGAFGGHDAGDTRNL